MAGKALADQRPLPGSLREAQREWYGREICMGDCNHSRPDCVEADRITECMKEMSLALQREMNEAVPMFRTQQEHDEYWADLKHASGEVPNGK